ncbi:DUF7524 family protein [Halorientalis salina]|uniref:DUF7524 family protein n=1 Tax=Halorientalis salina TaxID=2932266 RepID=UPI0010ABF3E2|nr:hypothetical protein [Halorientalis salina]
MPDTLPVHFNRQERHSLEVPPSFETADSFVIAVRNHGEAGRIHIHLDDGLPEIASIEDTNFYVQANGVTEIPVSVHGTDHVFGKIKVVSGYGAVTRWIDVEVTEPDEDEGVEVDEDLAKPQPRDDTETESTASPFAERPLVPVAGLGLLALLVAVGSAMAFDSALVALGALLVFGAVIGAGYLLFE